MYIQVNHLSRCKFTLFSVSIFFMYFLSHQSCYEKMKVFVKGHALLIGGLGIGIACLLIIGMALSCVLILMIE